MPPKKEAVNKKLVSPKEEDIPILDYLYVNNIIDENEAVKPIEIAKSVYGEQSKKKVVNPGLYRLLNLKLVIKIVNEKGTNPRWYLSPSYVPNSNTNSHQINLNIVPSTSAVEPSTISTVEPVVEPSTISTVESVIEPMSAGFIKLNLSNSAEVVTHDSIEETVLPPMPQIPTMPQFP